MKADIYVVQKIINALNKYKKFRGRSEPDEKAWNKLFRDQQRLVFNLDNHLKVFLYKDSLLSKLIYEGFEKTEEIFIQKYLRTDDLFFDIGSNIGLHTLAASTPLAKGGHVYAFEPTPVTFSRLLENVLENKLENMVTVLQLGLSDKTDVLSFNVSANGYDAWNSFADIKHITFESQISAEVIRFDDFVYENKIDHTKISLVKIDVEGWELNVLKGIETLFSDKNFNAAFLIEFTEENAFRAGYSCGHLYRYMTDFGYEWFNYNVAINELVPAPLKAYYPYENLIAIKNTNIEFAKARLTN